MISVGRKFCFIAVVSLTAIFVFTATLYIPNDLLGTLRVYNGSTSIRRKVQATRHTPNMDALSTAVQSATVTRRKENMTSADKSIFHVENHVDVRQGDIVVVLLQAFDANGVARRSGGDFWFAELHSKNFHFSTTGKIVDNNNGTYRLYFYAGVGGRMNVNITLVHPAEALAWLGDVYVPKLSFSWNGHFIANKTSKVIKECKLIHVDTDRQDQLNTIKYCSYGYGPKGIGHTALVCERPSKGFACDSLEYLEALGGNKALESPVDELLKGQENLFRDPNYMKEMAPKEIVIQQILPRADGRCGPDNPGSNSEEGICLADGIFPCCSTAGWCGNTVQHCETYLHRDYRTGHSNSATNDMSGNTSRSNNELLVDGKEESSRELPEGYWLETTWHSLMYNVTRWSSEEISQCLKGYQVIMLGDSTSRQLIWALDTRIKPWKETKDQGRFFHFRQASTFNLTFHYNRLNLLLFGLGPFKGPMEYFEPELIDRLPRHNCKYLIVIGLANHYASWPLADYKDRLVTLKRAVLNLRRQCKGGVDVVIKMAAPAHHSSFQARVHSNDWVFSKMNEIMSEVFDGMEAKFLRVWDMALSYPSPNNIHMPMGCIQNEIDLFLSQVCRS